jgi:fructan beta-fructosidase
MLKKAIFIIMITLIIACNESIIQSNPLEYAELHRPQIHFSPKEKWMNDPNGMLFFNNHYHLFYQYYPDSTVWGPMHWGHATSKDLVHWEHQRIALYPDCLGYIFSGSAVADINNTSGFGQDGKVPLVAIFTHHDPKGEREGRIDYQYQSIAYSLDEGKTWTKYAHNPVLKNPGIKDFRDPKVMWYDEGKKWIMTLATLDRITFYSSKDLKNWTKESEFGKEVGAHGGVWECPDLFTLNYQGKNIWVLLVSINPGGPNGGSATQYFTGEFNGKTFTPFKTDTSWIDYGPDNYAGVTWTNTGERKIFLGWISNWMYATAVPTEKWRSAMTVPRDLSIQKTEDKYLLVSKPIPELNTIADEPHFLNNIEAGSYDVSAKTGKLSGPAIINITSDKIESFSLILSNSKQEKYLLAMIN